MPSSMVTRDPLAATPAFFGKAAEVAPDVFMHPVFVNSFALRTADGLALIDPGFVAKPARDSVTPCAPGATRRCTSPSTRTGTPTTPSGSAPFSRPANGPTSSPRRTARRAFLFNSLNAVLAVIRTEPAKAERMLESIAELFRAVMADTRKLVPLAQEIELCRNYVEIEQTRLGNRLAVDWQIGAYHPRAKVPQLLLQPVIENAIRYGAEKLPGRADIIVRVRQHRFTLEMFVSNPIAPERPEREGNQIGLANIRGRLALMYDLEARIETQVRRDRFELTMTLPVEKGA